MDKKPASSRTHRPHQHATKTLTDFKSASTTARQRKPPSAVFSKAPMRPRSSHMSQKTTQVHGDEQTTNDIKFINVESRSSTEPRTPTKKRKTIPADEILQRCQETDYRQVYEIDLRGTQLTEIPNLEKFHKVRLIDLSSNEIQSIGKLECCAELKELKLYDNLIDVIEKLDSLSNLSHLQLQHNKIRGIGRGLVNCRKLLTLRLDWNQLTRLESKELAAMSKLTTLDLSNNKLDDISALNTLPNLMELIACNNRLKTIDLPRCKKVEEVDLTGNRFTDLNCFTSHASTLKILNLSKNAISRLELSSPLSQLEELYVSQNTVKRLGAVPTRLPSLQILDLSHNRIQNDKELLNLQECQLLRELNLLENPFDLDEYGQVSTNPAEIIPTLQVLDGIVIKKQPTDQKAPLMRPMSASHVISSRQVQSQLDSLDAEMRNLQDSLENKFREFRVSLDHLPSRPSSASSHRPATRGSRRSRIMEAKAFASNTYTNK